MNDEAFGPAKPFAPRSDFLAGGGYAEQIYELAYEVMGERERHLIPLDSEVSWMAGKTYIEVLQITHDDDTKRDQFNRNGPYTTTTDDLSGTYLGTAADWQEVEDSIKWVRDWWPDNIGPDPDQFDSMVAAAADAAAALYNEHSGSGAAGSAYASASTALEEWKSDAAREFRDHYWYMLPGVIGNQAVTAAVMAHGVSALRAAWSHHRANMEDVAQQTLVALEALKATPGSGADASSFLSILGGLLSIAGGVIAIPASGGASLAVAGAGVSIISGAVTVAQGTIAAKGTKVDIGAATVSSVLLNMASAGGTAKMEIEQADADIGEGLYSVYHTVTSNAAAHESGVDTSDLPGANQPDLGGLTLRDLYVFPAPLIVDPSEDLPDPPIST